MRQKQASRSLAETATKGRVTLVAYKNRSLQSVHEENWPRERRECFGSFEPVFNDLSLSVIVLAQPDHVGFFYLYGALGRIRTSDRLVRSWQTKT